MRAVLALLLLLTGAARAADLETAARQEGSVTWYTGLIVNQISRPLAEAFEAKYPGIHVNYARASNTDTTLKLLNEARAHRVQADVFDVTSGIDPLLAAHVVAPWSPPTAAHYPAVLKDPNGYWTATNLYFLTVAYNTNLVKPADAPQTFQDLLDPRWKGQMVWSSELAVQDAPGFIYNLLTVMGHDKAMDYLHRFAAQDPVAVAASPRAVLDQVISGEHALALQVYNHHVAISQGQGAPVAWVKMQPLLSLFNIMGITEGAPHPNAARLFEQWVLSADGQKVFAAHDYLPADPNVPARIPDLKPEAGHFDVTYVTPDVMKQGLAQWTAIYHEVFR
jgi:ABC-type Fe3+ transport system substrate-binding protein